MRTTTRVPDGCEHFGSQAEMPEELRAELRRCALTFGDTYAAYLATEPDRQYFWGAGRRGVVGFRRRGRYVLVGDGLLADPDDREALLTEFLAFAALNRWHTSYVNVPRNEINLFRRHGCEVTKCGEEPLVRLQRTQFQGRDWEWARRQENYCRRHGATFREVEPDPLQPHYRDGVAAQVAEISREHIAGTLHRRELSFFLSRFDPLDVRDRRLFVAEQSNRIVAFIVCNPGLAGQMWAVEVYRRRADALRGIVPALIMHVLRTLQAEGVGYVSLSLCPFLRCTPVAGDSRTFRWVANFWWRRLSAIYDMPGLFHFKSRFRPDYREMFIAAHPRVTVRSMWAIAMEWRLLHFNPLRLAARMLWRPHGAEHRQLAMPDRSSDRLIRDLRARAPHAALPAAPLLANVADAPAVAEMPPA